MKKQFIIYLLSFIILQALPAQAIKRINANPINIASQLVLKQDSAEVASTLEYYGYTHTPNYTTQSPTPQAPFADTDGFTVFSNPDGSIIRFAYLDNTDKQNYPIIQVYTKQSRTETEKKLQELDYKKNGNHYENILSKHSRYLTKCTFGPGKFLTFDRQKKQ